MNIIEKIEIKNFRSFGDAEKTKVYGLKDLNIFSGSNDSGKSNILRALNLFFYLDKIDFYQDFVFAKDFSRAHEERLRGQQKGKSFVEISILFAPSTSQFNSSVLPKKFWITKGFYDDSTKNFTKIKDEKRKEIQHVIKKGRKEINRSEDVRKAVTKFLKKINFQYIPAVKDRSFFDFLKEKYQDAIGKSEVSLSATDRKTIGEWITEMSSLNVTKILDEKIKEESTDLFADFSKRASEIKTANFNIPYLEINYSDAIDVQTDERIPLGNRGDGVQAKFIPVILDEIAKRNKEKPIVIWAFEEPENSYEYRNAQKLADEFLSEYSVGNQLFITTHSFNFLSLRGSCVSTYRVYKEEVKVKGLGGYESMHQVSRVFCIPERESGPQLQLLELEHIERERLEEELGIYELNKELDFMFREKQKEKEEYLKRQKDYETVLKSRPNKIFICEDSSSSVMNLWEQWLKEFGLSDIRIMSSEGSAKNMVENGVRHQMKLDDQYNPKIFRQIDRDGLTDQQLELIEDRIFKNEKRDLKYGYKFLPVNEVENFAVLADAGKFGDDFWKENDGMIADDFQRTAGSVCGKFVKYFDLEDEAGSNGKFRNANGDYISISQGMRDEAKSNRQKYFPGKTICAKSPNFNPIAFLSGLAKKDLPSELKSYLKEVKKFYES